MSHMPVPASETPAQVMALIGRAREELQGIQSPREAAIFVGGPTPCAI